MLRRAIIISVALVTSACSGSDEPEVDLVRRVRAEPIPQSFSQQQNLVAGGTVQAAGRDLEGRTVLVVDGEVQRHRNGSFESFLLYADVGEPTTMGSVHAISPRRAGGAWIAADNGLFLLSPPYVQFAGIAESVFGVVDVGSGPLAGLWFSTADGLEQQTDSQRVSYEIEGLSGPVDTFAIAADGSVGGVVFEGRPYVLGVDGDGVYADPTAESIPAASDMAATSGDVWVATEDGVYSFNVQSDSWTQRALAAQGSRATTMLAADAATDVVWARTSMAFVRIDGEMMFAFTATGAPEQDMFVDGAGDVVGVMGNEIVVHSLGSGGGDSFAADLMPWLEEHCLRCHGNQTADFSVLEVFRERAPNALARVRSGDMPRCEGGVRCADDQVLSPNDYAVLDQWIRSGMME